MSLKTLNSADCYEETGLKHLRDIIFEKKDFDLIVNNLLQNFRALPLFCRFHRLNYILLAQSAYMS